MHCEARQSVFHLISMQYQSVNIDYVNQSCSNSSFSITSTTFQPFYASLIITISSFFMSNIDPIISLYYFMMIFLSWLDDVKNCLRSFRQSAYLSSRYEQMPREFSSYCFNFSICLFYVTLFEAKSNNLVIAIPPARPAILIPPKRDTIPTINLSHIEAPNFPMPFRAICCPWLSITDLIDIEV